jgi:hypothetical protein
MFKAKRIEHADGRVLTEEELADWLCQDQSLLFKLRDDGVLIVCEARHFEVPKESEDDN